MRIYQKRMRGEQDWRPCEDLHIDYLEQIEEDAEHPNLEREIVCYADCDVRMVEVPDLTPEQIRDAADTVILAWLQQLDIPQEIVYVLPTLAGYRSIADAIGKSINRTCDSIMAWMSEHETDDAHWIRDAQMPPAWWCDGCRTSKENDGGALRCPTHCEDCEDCADGFNCDAHEGQPVSRMTAADFEDTHPNAAHLVN